MLKENNALWWMKISKKGKYLCYYSGDSSFQIYNLQGGRFIFSNKFYVWKRLESRFYSAGDFSPDEKYFVYMNPDSQTVVVDLDLRLSVPFYTYLTSQYVFNNSGKYYISQFAGAPSIVDFSNFDFNKAYSLYYSDGNQDERRESYNLLKEKSFNAGQGPVLDMFFTKEKGKLMVSTYATIKLDLSSGKSEQLHPSPPWVSMYNEWPGQTTMVPFKKSGISDTLFLYDYSQKTTVGKAWLLDSSSINCFAFYENDTKMLVAGKNGAVSAYDIKSGKTVFSLKENQKDGKQIIGIQNIPGTNQAALLRTGARPLILNVNTGIISDSINCPGARSITFSDTNYWIADTTGNLLKGRIGSYVNPDTVDFHAKSEFIDIVRISPSGKYLTILDVPWCHVMEIKTGKIIQSFIPELKNVQVLAISPDDSLLLAGSLNGEISIMKLTGLKPFASIFLPSPADPIFKDTSGYYLASKTALQHVVFTKGYRAFNFDQFDLELNQPHKVLAAIGYTDQSNLEAYEKAREKRLRKMGLTTAANAAGSTPSIIIHNRSNIKPATNQTSYMIRCECFDRKSKLADMKVFVNDVPHEEPLLNLSGRDTSSIIMNIAIPLTPGNNRVKIFCTNKDGIASYKEYIDIYCTQPRTQQKTWFIGIGVARYADTAQTLQYSVKDIRDMVKKFKSMFPDLVVDTLLDKKVTLKEIALLKKRMEKIALTDRVIMAITGHGLLSDSLDFFYATWDMNFNKPEEKGLPYSVLEEMLNKTASRQKILLIDACHSGLVDKENVVPSKSVILMEDSSGIFTGIKETRGIKPKVTQKVDEANTFNLMQQFFADFSNDNGIVVISAAGGLEYAL
ncbi:MAG: caspase family protein, partial [Chitinophagaceae bacterium]|nr:caspase family protein [Chitinophagaceae bacterium]